MLFFNSLLRYSVGRSKTEAVFFFQKVYFSILLGGLKTAWFWVIVFWALHAWSALIQAQVHLSMLPIHSQLWFASFPCFFHLVLIKMGVCQHVFLGWAWWAVLDTKLVGKEMLVRVKVLSFHAMLCQNIYGRLVWACMWHARFHWVTSSPSPPLSPWNVFSWVIADMSVCFNTCFYFWHGGDQKYKIASLYGSEQIHSQCGDSLGPLQGLWIKFSSEFTW